MIFLKKIGIVDITKFTPRNCARLEVRVNKTDRCFVGLNIVEVGSVCTVSAWVEPERMRTELGWKTNQMSRAVAEVIVMAGIDKLFWEHRRRLANHFVGNNGEIVFTFRRMRGPSSKLETKPSSNKIGTVDIGDLNTYHRNYLMIVISENKSSCSAFLNIIETDNICMVSTPINPESLRGELGWETHQMDWAVAETVIVAGVERVFSERSRNLISYAIDDKGVITFVFRHVRSHTKK